MCVIQTSIGAGSEQGRPSCVLWCIPIEVLPSLTSYIELLRSYLEFGMSRDHSPQCLQYRWPSHYLKANTHLTLRYVSIWIHAMNPHSCTLQVVVFGVGSSFDLLLRTITHDHYSDQLRSKESQIKFHTRTPHRLLLSFQSCLNVRHDHNFDYMLQSDQLSQQYSVLCNTAIQSSSASSLS